MLKRDDILAVDVVTDGSTHHQVAVPALLAGKHALVEKPLGITMRACQSMIDAASEGGAVLATAENYRRDPPNRLARGRRRVRPARGSLFDDPGHRPAAATA